MPVSRWSIRPLERAVVVDGQAIDHDTSRHRNHQLAIKMPSLDILKPL